MHAFLLTLPLLLAPPSDEPLATLDAALEQVSRDPETGLAQLVDALAALEVDPLSLIDDPRLLERRTLARLALARAYQSLNKFDLAAAAMDTALRRSAGLELPADQLGPRTRALHDDRRELLLAQGQARVEVRCQVPCRVFVDEHEVSNPSPPLFLGEHRISVLADDGTTQPEQRLVQLEQAEQLLVLEYPRNTTQVLDDEVRFSPRARAREPVPGHVFAIVGGSILAGGLVLGVYGSVHMTKEAEVLVDDSELVTRDYRPQAAAILGTGVAFTLAGTALLSVGLVRHRKRAPRLAPVLHPRYVGLTVHARF